MRLIKHKTIMKHFFLLLLILSLLFYSCEKVRESAGVNRKSPDEFAIVENPPLIIPPDYNLIPPDQLQERDISNIETELAEEILFGLEDKNLTQENQLSTMSQILSEAKAENASNDIRNEIDEDFAKEISSEKELQFFT